MAIVARLDLDRSDRVAFARATTLRDEAQVPTDVVLDNLSTSGCLITVDLVLAMETVVSVAIPGVGACFARIVRCDRPNYGCEFLRPITSAEIASVYSTETVIHAAFPRIRAPLVAPPEAAVAAELAENGLPIASRVTIILGISAMLWAGIVTSVIIVAR